MKNYTGNRQPLVSVLRHSADAARADAILSSLEGHGFRLCVLDENSKAGKAVKKSCAVIAVLSESFYQSETLADALIAADAADREIIPANLDDSAPDESLGRAFRARNTVFRSRYGSDEEFAQRLLTADALKKPFITPEQKRSAKILAIGAAVAAVAIVLATALSLRSGGEIEPAPTEAPEEENEFLKYTGVVLLGDNLVEANSIWDVCSEDRDEDENCIWRLNEDGSEVGIATSTDLSFLQYMTNLRSLVLVNQTATELPDLSALTKLHTVEIWECDFSDVSGLSACPNLTFLHLTARVSDLSCLSAFPSLQTLHLLDDCDRGCLESLEGLSAPKLTEIQLHSETLRDLSGLSGCPKLTNVDLNVPKVRDFSALGTLFELQELYLDNCRNCRDLSCLSSCMKLKKLQLQNLWSLNGDLSCLENHTALEEIFLFCTLNSLDFLKTLSPDKRISLGFCDSNLNDFEGLANIKKYNTLHLNLSGRSIDRVLPWLQDAQVMNLELYDCMNVTLSELPSIYRSLQITGGNLTGLEGLQRNLDTLDLQNLTRLETLSGIESTDLRCLSVTGCPRLTDWSPLYNMELDSLELTGTYELPDFSAPVFLKLKRLILKGIAGVTDLEFLSPLSANREFPELTLVGMDGVNNLKPLEQLKGDRLVVSPRLEEQGRELVEKGCFTYCSVDYDTLDWLNNYEFTLLSLDEIDELPDSLLARVSSLVLVGDVLVDDSTGQWWSWQDNGRGGGFYVVYSPDGTETVAKKGTLEGFDALQKLTGLRRLKLYDQPLKSLEGLQNLTELEELEIDNAPDVKDITPVFALPSLRFLRLHSIDFTSLDGIQNLRHLEQLDLGWCGSITDFAPLGEISGGLEYLNMDGLVLTDWIDAVSAGGCPEVLQIFNSLESQKDLELLCERLPGARELELKWNDRLTDLTPLLSLTELTCVRVSNNMQRAFDSIAGTELPFELIMED